MDWLNISVNINCVTLILKRTVPFTGASQYVLFEIVKVNTTFRKSKHHI